MIEWLGDVLFIRSTDRTHREIEGLLRAIRQHGPWTYVNEPALHDELRVLLSQPIDVDFDDTPLSWAVETLAEAAGADIRLDEIALQDVGVRTREPVSLTLKNRSLQTVLVVLVKKHGLTWSLEDGVLWITTEEIADEKMKTAVFDVSDLARTEEEAIELLDAVQDQTDGQWEDIDGIGGDVLSPMTGTLVVRQTEKVIDQVTGLLATYREALKNSKPREQVKIDPDEVLTRFYRVDETMAEDLTELIPKLVQPASWHPEEPTNDAPRILVTSAGYKLLDSSGAVLHSAGGRGKDAIVVPQKVLMIRQTRTVHKEIGELIQRIEQGDPLFLEDEIEFKGGGGGGFGGGLIGKGGGFFTVPPDEN